MSQFILLLPHAPARYQGMSEDDYMDIIKDYVAWTEKMTADGVYVMGEKLVDETGKVLNRNGDTVEVHDMPMTELAEILGGFMVIEAADYNAAVEVAKTCPHLLHNDRIELREIHAV